MRPQLWIPDRHPRKLVPRRDRMGPPRNRKGFGVKPAGGMWTSTYGEKENWLWWCHVEGMPGFVNRRTPWLLTPDPGVKLYTIDTYSDLQWLWSTFPLENDPVLDRLNSPPIMGFVRKWVDWGKVAEVYDGVHLTAAGQWATRLPGFNNEEDMGLDLYGWDCESTWWARWVWIDMRPLPKISMPWRKIRDHQKSVRNMRLSMAYQRRTGKIAFRIKGEMVELASFAEEAK